MQTKTVEARITGRVQGVCFRAWTQEEASKRGLRGWVRNSDDGSVEALFSGPAEAVDEMLDACREGPMAARVDAVDTHEVSNQPAGAADFEILR